MVAGAERWPPVYDAESLAREIQQLTQRPDLPNGFYEWRRDRSEQSFDDVCQGDVVHLESDVPVILADGQPGTIEHPGSHWLVIGNTCDFERDLADARWTQLVPIDDLGEASGLAASEAGALLRYTQSRRFLVPAWSKVIEQRVHVADLLRPVAVDKRALVDGTIARIEGRMSRPAWVLLNACLVRFLARDDGRYDP